MSDLASLINAVEQADSSAQLIEAVRRLAATGHAEAVPTLITVLSYNNPGAAVAAVDGLVKIGEPAVAPLLEQLDQHNYTARSWAIRALAGIGDPRGFVTLLGVATADFSLSVRRAAARGIGAMKWHWFPEHLLEIAQEEAMEALLFVAQQDEEWVVRYAAVVGLESLACDFTFSHPEWRSHIEATFAHLAIADESWAVRARVWKAQQHLQGSAAAVAACQPQANQVEDEPSPLSPHDWQDILDKLYERKRQERVTLPEGDPRRYRELVGTVTHNAGEL
ncbi:MAG TPA: HEAT repeat domain-containing protein [Synechococcales cyanobacterium M55_K2018_004]|nr:HEAT repeat domain-containing protein [Synechococcales cyanobacterium M55_K2018_004]